MKLIFAALAVLSFAGPAHATDCVTVLPPWLTAMLGAIAPFLLGGLGWFVTSFFAKPYLNFRNLRSQVDEELICADDPRYRQVADSLRRLGVKVFATNKTESRVLRWYLSKARYDLVTAGGGLIGLSSSLVDQHPAHRVIYTDIIENGLKLLPRSSLPEYVRHMKEEIHTGAARRES
jgi:hypothetical protein